MNLTIDDLYDKKRIAYELIISSIDLFLKNDRKYDVCIYNSLHTAWNLIYELKINIKRNKNIDIGILEKEKLHNKNNNINFLWNYMKHAAKDDLNEFVVANLLDVNFHLIVRVIQDFLRIEKFYTTDYCIPFLYDIEKLKKYSLIYKFLEQNDDCKSELEYKTDKEFFIQIEKTYKDCNNEFELMNKLL